MSAPILIALVIFIEFFLHYFRWREALQGHELPRPIAYVLGVAGMMIPFTIWLIQERQLETITMLWMVIISGGLAVVVSYAIDWVIGLVWKLREARQREKEALTGLKEAIDGESKTASH